MLRVAVAAELLWLLSAVLRRRRARFVPVGIGVFVCHAIAYLVDVRRGTADPRRHASALLYLVQLPVFPAGPLSRFHEFSEQLSRSEISMGGFSYGVRRIVTGLLKVWAIAGPLGDAADRIFALRVTRLSTDIAWLGAVCAALEVYFLFSGFSDIGIGLGRILGFRYQENFRRPYTADSIREFWRRWNVTLIAWLRDYLSLPIAGHDVPTIGRYLLTVAGFVVVGLWHRTDPARLRVGGLLRHLARDRGGRPRPRDRTPAARICATSTCCSWSCPGGSSCGPAVQVRCSVTSKPCSASPSFVRLRRSSTWTRRS